ncbi:MAG: anion transporter [candidate division KSB1 bacterium]|nr:anion transporter [candidate division KSB1 bacterium]
MNSGQLLILLIFVATYAIITVQRLPGVRIDRPSGVTIGSTLLLLTGLVRLEEAYRFIDWNVIVFLLGMMILVAYLEFGGFFEYTAAWLIRIAPSARSLLLVTILASALLSALFVNDTVCLLLTPVLLKATRLRGLNPIPYLVAVATAANIGSALTVIGNPQNMYIAIQSHLPFLRFTALMLVPVAMGLALNYGVIRGVYRQEFAAARFPKLAWEPPRWKRTLVLKTLLALAFTLGLFVIGVPYPLAALIGACLIMLAAYVPPRHVLKNVDWTVLLFFAGLFVVMGAFRKAGYVDGFFALASRYLADGRPIGYLGLAGGVAVLSNLVSNVPAVILMQPVIERFGQGPQPWVLLAMSSTFAGNLTLLGSVANLLVAERAQAKGVRLEFFEYLRVGFPLGVLTIAFGALWLWLLK